LDPTTLAIVLAGFLFASTLKGIVGIGQITTAVAILGTVMSLREAVPLLVLPAIASNIVQACEGGGLGATVRRFGLLNAAGCAGIWLGTVILYLVEPSVPVTLLGVLVCAYCAMNLMALRLSVPRARERLLLPVVGAVSGVLTCATGSLHLLLAAYYQAIGLAKDKYVQANAVSFLIGGVVWVAALADQGVMTRSTLTISVLILIPTFAGLALGRWLRRRVPEATFRICVYVFLLLLGLNLIRKGAF
jgi:uncharacterized membrane protein YfcA